MPVAAIDPSDSPVLYLSQYSSISLTVWKRVAGDALNAKVFQCCF